MLPACRRASSFVVSTIVRTPLARWSTPSRRTSSWSKKRNAAVPKREPASAVELAGENELLAVPDAPEGRGSFSLDDYEPRDAG